MRAIAAVIGLALIQACVASIRATPAPEPWKIVEDWTIQLPAGGMQVYPAYTSVPGIYVATTSAGNVVGINTTSRGIQWTNTYDDVSFLESVVSENLILVARQSGTTAVDASTGVELWTNTSVLMSPNLAESYNVLTFDSTVVYRDQSNGFVRLCAVNTKTGNIAWCDNRRTLGSPDAANNNTFTAQLFDAEGNAFVANIEAATGLENWIAQTDRILTGCQNYVAVINGTSLTIVNSMTGLGVSSRDITGLTISTAVFVSNSIFSFGDGANWIAAIDSASATLLWNKTADNSEPGRLIQLQHQGDSILVAASLSFTATNFTRYNALTGAVQWNVQAKPTGMSLAPVHAWLNTDILYVRVTENTWAAYGADSGNKISSGTGNLFLPASVEASYLRPHFSFYVTTNGGQMIDLRIEANN
jgi:hypothetical protein